MTIRELVASYPTKITYRRWFATLIDFFILWMLIAAIGAFIRNYSLGEALLLVFGVSVVYYIFTERLVGQTIGKAACRIVVVDENGKRPKLWPIVLRTLTRFVELNPLLFGCLPALVFVNFSKFKQRLGDRLAGTYVVFKKDLPVLPTAEMRTA